MSWNGPQRGRYREHAAGLLPAPAHVLDAALPGNRGSFATGTPVATVPATSHQQIIEERSERLIIPGWQPPAGSPLAQRLTRPLPSRIRAERSTRYPPATSPTRTLAPITAVPQSVADEALVPRHNFPATHTHPNAQKKNHRLHYNPPRDKTSSQSLTPPPTRAPSRRTLPGRSPGSRRCRKQLTKIFQGDKINIESANFLATSQSGGVPLTDLFSEKSHLKIPALAKRTLNPKTGLSAHDVLLPRPSSLGALSRMQV